MPIPGQEYISKALTYNDAVWDNIGTTSASTMLEAWSFPRSAMVASTVISRPNDLLKASAEREKIWQTARDAVDRSNGVTAESTAREICAARDAFLTRANGAQRDENLQGTPALRAANKPVSSTQDCLKKKSSFDDEFKGWTGGMTVDQSIELYKEQTGATLTPEQVQRLFTDRSYATVQMMSDENLHKIYRTILNSQVPENEDDAICLGYKKMPESASRYHNPIDNPTLNKKYISPSGHMEVIYGPNGNRVTSLDYTGSFNFYPSDGLSPIPFYKHMAVDYLPYNKWGN